MAPARRRRFDRLPGRCNGSATPSSIPVCVRVYVRLFVFVCVLFLRIGRQHAVDNFIEDVMIFQHLQMSLVA
jgi:hypothetical protein